MSLLASSYIRLNVYFKLVWTDELLTWNPEDHSNISVITPYSDSIWMPSINQGNTLSDEMVHLVALDDAFPVLLNSDGQVTWTPPAQLHTTCTLDMTKFPNDQHACTFFILLNSYPADQVYLNSSAGDSIISTSWLNDGQWELQSATVFTSSFMFLEDQNRSALSLMIRFQRLPTFFVLNLLFPTCALSFLNILVFILPASSGEKVSYSITVLLSMMVFMSTTTSVLPPTSLSVPLVTQFLTTLTIISILSVVATVFSVFVHHLRERQEAEHGMIVKVLQSLTKLKGGNELSSAHAQSEKKKKNGDGAGDTALFWRGKTSSKVFPSDDECLERASSIIGLDNERSVEPDQIPSRSPSKISTELIHTEKSNINFRNDESLPPLEEPPSYQVSETSNQWVKPKIFSNTLNNNNNQSSVAVFNEKTRTIKTANEEESESREKNKNQGEMCWNGKKLASTVNKSSSDYKSSDPQDGVNIMTRNKGLRLVFSKHLDTEEDQEYPPRRCH
ncbi:neuronal acetylcholine receptor subunit beta-3-like [Aplysia californica]|uniref:Neuronal acetylcholine receptor subunit beta-3-like n=1 Tax=Aplysia californica TaxID=6500 RepID=A0ABM0K1U7_APLCA|nr:neuronal acetylcholine receptor subunit beta-3-like [Aplysia californica]